MEEAKKIKRVIAKAETGARTKSGRCWTPTPGRNSVSQIKAFDEALGLTGLILTKLDGTAKGGAVCAIARQRPLRCDSWASARAPTICARSCRRIGRGRFSTDHGHNLVPARSASAIRGFEALRQSASPSSPGDASSPATPVRKDDASS